MSLVGVDAHHAVGEIHYFWRIGDVSVLCSGNGLLLKHNRILMKKFVLSLRSYRFPLLSLALIVLAFGLQTPGLGFYWDDLPLAWFSHQFGPGYFINYEPYRPVSGLLYFFSFSFLHESPLAWQLYGLLWRWLCVLAFWWLLRLLWSKTSRQATIVALLFALYPGFSQQPIALIYSLYFMYYTLFLLSLCFMLLAVRANRYWTVLLTGGALVLSLVTMFSTEYFYGLEILRPLLLWLVLRGRSLTGLKRWRRALMAWAPYLLAAIGVLTWRYMQSLQIAYESTLMTNLAKQPLSTLTTLLATMLGDFFEAGLAAWGRLAEPFAGSNFHSRSFWASVLVLLAGAGLGLLAIGGPQLKSEKEGKNSAGEAIAMGAVALLLSGLAFWVADLPMRLSFPWDRFTLPMMFGVALIFGGIFETVEKYQTAKIALLSILLGLCSTYQFWNGNEYRLEWRELQNFFAQMQWRVPGLEANTALLSTQLRALPHYSDNSLTAPLNWIYSGEDFETLPYYLAFLDVRTGKGLFGIGDEPIEKPYRSLNYVGNSADIVLFIYEPPGCLRILDPQLDMRFPRLPELLEEQVGRSNLRRILPERVKGKGALLFPARIEDDWCYYYELADLSRQSGDWQRVASLGEEAFSLNLGPHHPAELTPFVEASAMLGQWEMAADLTREAIQINAFVKPLFCDLWQKISASTPVSAKREQILGQVGELLTCSTD